MKIHELKRKTKNKKYPLIGRGGKRGKTSGRGGKGQTARAGHKARPEMRDIIKRMPKLRGYAFNSKNEKPVAVNIAALDSLFVAGATVSPKTLVEKGAIELFGGTNPIVKILATGDLSKKLVVTGCLVSAEAKAKIEKAGGTVK